MKSNTVFATTEATMQKEVWDMIGRIRGELAVASKSRRLGEHLKANDEERFCSGL